ncbi:MAG: hypothetical protein NT069_20650 [Planctomycetota bacterium]|nr:hypothetical protein [Planctomycetota bacterium]
MSKPYDAILKHLPEDYPQDWAQFVGVNGPVSVIDADISTVTAAAADKVLRVDEPDPWILHLEFQAGHDATLSRRLLNYNVLLGVRHALPVRSVAILLRPRADGKDLTGSLQCKLPRGKTYLEFEYDLIRLWQLPPEAILEGGIGTLPLAPLTKVSRLQLPNLVREMAKRFDRDGGRAAVDSLWTATYVLLGLEYPKEFANQLLRGVRSMKESVTYQAILEEGRELGREVGREEGREEARRILLALGTKRFGKPSTKIRRAVAGITEPAVFEGLAVRMLDVESWTELLAEME